MLTAVFPHVRCPRSSVCVLLTSTSRFELCTVSANSAAWKLLPTEGGAAIVAHVVPLAGVLDEAVRGRAASLAERRLRVTTLRMHFQPVFTVPRSIL